MKYIILPITLFFSACTLSVQQQGEPTTPSPRLVHKRVIKTTKIVTSEVTQKHEESKVILITPKKTFRKHKVKRYKNSFTRVYTRKSKEDFFFGSGRKTRVKKKRRRRRRKRTRRRRRKRKTSINKRDIRNHPLKGLFE